jgi:hypothetical protein
MSEPTLDVLEACHRLALIEGQKENSEEEKEKGIEDRRIFRRKENGRAQ